MASTTSFSGVSLRVPQPLPDKSVVLACSRISIGCPRKITGNLVGGFRPMRLKQRSFTSRNGGQRSRTRCFLVDCKASNGKISEHEFTEMAWRAIVSSPDVAKANKQHTVETEHLMKALLEQKNRLTRRIFSKAGVDITRLLEATDRFIQCPPAAIDESALDSLIDRARRYRIHSGDSFVCIEHLLLGFCQDERFGMQLFETLGISERALTCAIEDIGLADAVTADLKMGITSKPAILKVIDQSVLNLEEEMLLLGKDTDGATMDRPKRLEAALSVILSTLKERQARLTELWERGKSIMTMIQSIDKRFTSLANPLKEAEKEPDQSGTTAPMEQKTAVSQKM